MNRSDQNESGFVSIGDARLYVEECGIGLPLVLIHAGIADLRMWDPQVDRFSTSHRVVRYDMRSFGRTESGSGAFHDWEDLARVFEKRHIGPAVLIGASMGARVAVEFALGRPELVRALVLMSPGLFDKRPRSVQLREAWSQIEEALDAGQMDRVLDIESRLWVVGPERDPSTVDSDVLDRVREMNERAWQMESAARERQEMSPPAATRLGEIRVPTLVISGQDDVADSRKIAGWLSSEIEQARLVTIDHAAHMLNMEHPEQFSDVVLQFVDSLGRND